MFRIRYVVRKTYFPTLCYSEKLSSGNITKNYLRDLRSQLSSQLSRPTATKVMHIPTTEAPGISCVKILVPSSKSAPATLQRLAVRADIADIEACNLRNLPENYTPAFFERHIALWPELSLVSLRDLRSSALGASPLSSFSSSLSSGRSGTIDMGMSSSGREDVLHTAVRNAHEGAFAGYALGRLEEVAAAYTTNPWRPVPKYIGHVTSVAVHEEFRGLGVAKKLMNALHTQLCSHYQIDVVQLHVRVSNMAAISLYEKFGYEIIQHIPEYYADKEPAYLMQLKGLMACSNGGGNNTVTSNWLA